MFFLLLLQTQVGCFLQKLSTRQNSSRGEEGVRSASAEVEVEYAYVITAIVVTSTLEPRVSRVKVRVIIVPSTIAISKCF